MITKKLFVTDLFSFVTLVTFSKLFNLIIIIIIIIIINDTPQEVQTSIPYSRVIRRMRPVYLHRKRICAYKRAAPNKELRLNSSACHVHARIAHALADHALHYYNIEDNQTKDRLEEVPDPSLEVEDLTRSQPKLKSRWSCW